MDYTDFNRFDGSSSLARAWYNKNANTLAIEFVGGNVAGYRGVAIETWKGLLNAASAGRFYNSNIRGWHSGMAVDADYGMRYIGEEVTAQAKQQFSVTATISGEVTLTVEADDLAGALVAFQNQVAAQDQGAQYTINFKAVSAV